MIYSPGNSQNGIWQNFWTATYLLRDAFLEFLERLPTRSLEHSFFIW